MSSSSNAQPPPSRQPANTGRRVLVIVGLTLGAVCLVCCGGPTIAYFVIKREITARIEAPATPKPLSPNELFRWYGANKPTQPFVWKDPTRDAVEMTGTVLEANWGEKLRTAGSTDKGRQPVDTLEGWQKERYQSLGESQLIFRGERNDQEVACWFESVEAIKGVQPGDEVVVRGRRASMVSGSGGFFVIDLAKCRLVSD